MLRSPLSISFSVLPSANSRRARTPHALLSRLMIRRHFVGKLKRNGKVGERRMMSTVRKLPPASVNSLKVSTMSLFLPATASKSCEKPASPIESRLRKRFGRYSGICQGRPTNSRNGIQSVLYIRCACSIRQELTTIQVIPPLDQLIQGIKLWLERIKIFPYLVCSIVKDGSIFAYLDVREAGCHSLSLSLVAVAIRPEDASSHLQTSHEHAGLQ
jgi:hypothetical protein